ncbi:MAG: MBL fold metallo-hydrolase [Pontiellaceae bacterium]|nr:MBL fold metallo-hydrolase [Pontiellaceae bacterium]
MSAMPKVKILVDNHAAPGLLEEHGFAAWIEAGGKRILFDTGAGKALRPNTEQTPYDASRAEMLVLSHGHFDHTGAVDYVLERNPEIQVYAHLGIFRERYSLYEGKPPKEISMPSEQRLVTANLLDSKLHWVREPLSIAPGVWLSGPIPRNHPMEDVGGPYFQDAQGRWPDSIPDDQSLWIETSEGLLVICGCCHAGLINTLEHIRTVSDGAPILGIIGGFHLGKASTERLKATVDVLRELNLKFLIPCHCTGSAAVDYLKQNLSFPVQAGFAGFEL